MSPETAQTLITFLMVMTTALGLFIRSELDRRDEAKAEVRK